MTTHYTPREERTLIRALGGDQAPVCPQCGTGMDRRPVPPQREVSYVRHRVVLVCPGCRRTAALDLPRPEE